MKLSTLTAQLDVQATTGIPPAVDPDVTALCYDSREVVPGAVFVAIEGFAVDGHRYIPEAVQKGALAVVCRKPVTVGAAVIGVADTRRALASMACRFYEHPADRMMLVGVTGTNGKTTVTYLLEQILKAAGLRPGVIGTINYRYADNIFENPVTTPESLELQSILREMADGGVTHVLMEVSSHALDLSRVDGCRFDTAVFTNLTQDHLDHHGDMHHYWASKKKLFVDYLKPADAGHPIRVVVNADDPKGAELVHRFGAATLRTSTRGNGDILPLAVTLDLAGIRGRIVAPGGEIPFSSPLVGDFNLENILSAAGAAQALGIAPEAISAGINTTTCVPGRLERIDAGGRRPVFVDYAHTPDALENAIVALRALAPGRLIVVFGCGGDRDSGKRPIMGEIAGRMGDLAVVTSDNPRSEDPLAIIAQVEAGVRQASTRRFSVGEVEHGWQGNGYLVVPDRLTAIEAAIRAAGNGDAVLVAGKGHETYQVLAGETIHFDDREVARNVLTAISQRGA